MIIDIAEAVYSCTYRELYCVISNYQTAIGISLYLQGTHASSNVFGARSRYIPVPTGNSDAQLLALSALAVYPCTYRELI